ncbi:tripartite tricarboxylate transporter substrate binding protein [Ramlibacter sp. G-1-2-2]|uniref:Tripartite tricarboxylate transporter substrate binding protein n=1 Tax=Ramlibacter agri TaxID=2728837 RepID=A0A848HDZ8_9BURK|nr:tripartite tricarboxylate transporter substrate binding protein [Ramlibacter agri]NML47581.1 tripartite tricarboxylate transporter substrate binding protein [Ramlibacter agri]
MIRALLAVALALSAAAASADGWPEHSIKLIVPSAAGGSVDRLARSLGDRLSKRLGQPVVVENRAGAGGAIATEGVATSKPDGYTLLLGTIAGLATNVSLEHLRYDPLKDFAPISLVATQDFVLCVGPQVPANSVQDVLAMARAKPRSVAYASAGRGTGSHLSGELLGQMAKVQLLHVPYKGMSQATTDVVGGQVPIVFSSLASAQALVAANKLKALAVTGRKRAPMFPGVPTLAESGVKGYESSTWYGLVAPAATPAPVLRKLGEEVRAILKDRDLQKTLDDEGIVLVGSDAQGFHDFMKHEIDKWRTVARSAGLKAE